MGFQSYIDRLKPIAHIHKMRIGKILHDIILSVALGALGVLGFLRRQFWHHCPVKDWDQTLLAGRSYWDITQIPDLKRERCDLAFNHKLAGIMKRISLRMRQEEEL